MPSMILLSAPNSSRRVHTWKQHGFFAWTKEGQGHQPRGAGPRASGVSTTQEEPGSGNWVEITGIPQKLAVISSPRTFNLNTERG